MLIRIVMSALLAGALAGVLVFAGHMWKTTPLIVHAEAYEGGGAVSAAHAHAHGDEADKPTTAPPAGHEGHGHSHGDGDEWAPADGLERNAFTLLSDVITAIGFAFLLIGAMVLSGRQVNWKSGMVWGLCGYAAFYLAPAFGLSPELPGMLAAELTARQAWWLGTAAVTAVALALMFFADGLLWKVAAGLLIVVPHVIGAPHPPIEPGAVPAELAAQFAVATLVVTGLFWLALGAFSGYFLDRFEDTA